MPTIFQTFRHLQRYQQIGRILTRYGFGHILTQLGIGRAITPGLERLRFSSAEILRATPAERVRMVVEELGPTFIKLGQILSTRADLIGRDLADELSQLQSKTPPDPPEVVRATVEEELGKPVDELYAEFDASALASASIGQVHRAKLDDGQSVVVKVQHNGIRDRVTNDLEPACVST